MRVLPRVAAVTSRRVGARLMPMVTRRAASGSLGGASAATVGGVLALGSVAGAALYYAMSGGEPAGLRDAIVQILDNEKWDDGSIGPVLVRLAWHASGTYCAEAKTGGSPGATMRFAPEMSDDANAGLDKARAFLEPIKKKFPDVSYADLWIFAGYVAIEEMGGPKIAMRWGRKDAPDGNQKCKCLAVPPNGRLPDAAQGAKHVRDVFYRMGFNDQEITALVGAGHAIGRCHTDRSGFDGPWTRAPTTFSNEYFRVLFEEKWEPRRWNGPKQWTNPPANDLMMLPTDMVFATDPEFRKWSLIYKDDYSRYEKDFAAAFKKLTELGM